MATSVMIRVNDFTFVHWLMIFRKCPIRCSDLPFERGRFYKVGLVFFSFLFLFLVFLSHRTHWKELECPIQCSSSLTALPHFTMAASHQPSGSAPQEAPWAVMTPSTFPSIPGSQHGRRTGLPVPACLDSGLPESETTAVSSLCQLS